MVSGKITDDDVAAFAQALDEVKGPALAFCRTGIVLRLQASGVTFHLSEVKGPVMDRLQRSSFLEHLTGEVFLSQYHAMTRLDPETTCRAAQAALPAPPARIKVALSPLRPLALGVGDAGEGV